MRSSFIDATPIFKACLVLRHNDAYEKVPFWRSLSAVTYFIGPLPGSTEISNVDSEEHTPCFHPGTKGPESLINGCNRSLEDGWNTL